MAKRSDFAQKLLGDLILRKERMAMSQSSSNSNRIHEVRRMDANGSFRRPSRGYRQIGTSTGDAQRSSGTRRNTSFSASEASREIVPIGGAQRSEHIDLSMVLVFALENGIKVGKMESSGDRMVSFLNHIGTQSLDLGKMDRRRVSGPADNRFPTLSHLHIADISKGAQKLNQMLKACSNGLKFNRYSVDIGNELLKGAMDLEDSLRMLVNLQEASENMISNQRKHKIRLLEEDEEDDTTINENDKKQLDLPRFSFDRPSRSSHKDMREATKTTFLEQMLLALPYFTEHPHPNPGKQASNISSKTNSGKQGSNTSSKTASHKRSVSYSPDASTSAAFSYSKPEKERIPLTPDSNTSAAFSYSKPEKGRIPNVIAKLMGLEEIPRNIDSKHEAQKDSSSKQSRGKELKQIASGSTKKVEHMKTDSENHANQTVRQKILVTQDSAHETVISDGKPHWKDREGGNMNLISYSRPTLQISMQAINPTQSNHITRTRKDNQEKERSRGKDEATKLVTKDYLQMMAPQIYKQSEATYVKHEKAYREENTPQKEQKNMSIKYLMPNNQQKHSEESKFQQAYVFRKSKSHKEKLIVEREQQNAKINLQVRKPKGSNTVTKNSVKPTDAKSLQKKLLHMDHATAGKRNSIEASESMPSKGPTKSSHHEGHIKEDGSNNLKLQTGSSSNRSLKEQSAYPKDPVTDVDETIACIPQVMIKELASVPPIQNATNKQEMDKSKTPRKIDEAVARTGSPRYKSRSLKQQIPVLQELKQRKQEKISGSKGVSIEEANETKACTIRSMKAEESMHQLNLVQHLHKEDYQTSIPGKPVKDACQRPEEPDNTTPNAAQDPALDKDQALESCNFMAIQLKGPHERHVLGISKSSQQEHQQISKSGTHNSLTENENQLKQILTKCQFFLNAAEALFKLRIPVDILHASAHKRHDEDNKLVLDCSYEVMKRKGRRQELNSHPCVKFPIGSKKVKSLDDLVKELHGDLENLKLYRQNGSNKYDASDHLHKLLERDIQNRDPDMTCMWDFGWSEIMFLCLEKDVVRDLEKHLLNGIIDEITRDMVLVSIAI